MSLATVLEHAGVAAGEVASHGEAFEGAIGPLEGSLLQFDSLYDLREGLILVVAERRGSAVGTATIDSADVILADNFMAGGALNRLLHSFKTDDAIVLAGDSVA